MRLHFLGPRGEIERRSRKHRRHSSLLVRYRRRSLLIDCGIDWLGRLDAIVADAVVLTHAHPDHAGGLRRGCPWPVYATAETSRALARYPIEDRAVIAKRDRTDILGMTIEAFPLEHSLVAPAVGYRIAAGKATIFYAPDVVSIRGRRPALADVELYVGDGAAVGRSIVRYRDGVRIGHASIREQLDWCAKSRVSRAIFTHCGSEIVGGDEHIVAAKVETLGRERGVRASIAHDGLEVSLP